jgi:hypothetical protein
MAGAPSKLTQKLIDELSHYISRGVAVKYAVDAVGISQECYYRWIREGAKFKEEGWEGEKPPQAYFYETITKIKADFIQEAIENIKKAGATRKNWQANTWLLEKLYSGGYGKDSTEVLQLAKDIEEIKRILFADIDPMNQHSAKDKDE